MDCCRNCHEQSHFSSPSGTYQAENGGYRSEPGYLLWKSDPTMYSKDNQVICDFTAGAWGKKF